MKEAIITRQETPTHVWKDRWVALIFQDSKLALTSAVSLVRDHSAIKGRFKSQTWVYNSDFTSTKNGGPYNPVILS